MKRIMFLILSSIVLASCGTVAPAVIGTETRANLDKLADQQTTSALQAEQVSSSVESVHSDLVAIAEHAPDEWKPEIQKIVEKSAESVSLVYTLKSQLADERATTKLLKDSARKDSEATAKIESDKEKAEKGELKAKNERNIALMIAGILAVVVAISVVLKIKKIF